MALMIDNAVKTSRLLDALKGRCAIQSRIGTIAGQLSFERNTLLLQIRTQHIAIADQTEHTASDLSYAGDEGGIVCHIVPSEGREALVISLTQVRAPRSMPHYHNHRVKKLKNQCRF
jgi:hypothetical protein